jgi:hypothetical protein
MKMKRLGSAFVVICVLGAMMAGSALAAAVTEDVTWTIEGTTLSGSETVSATGSNEFVWEVGSTLLKLKSTGLECIGCKIENSGGAAIGTGKLKFTGVTVAVPSTCAVEGGAVETADVKIRADYMIGTSDYWLFEPDEGTTFATFKLIKGSGSCVISGTYSITGTDFVKANNATGVLAESQGVTSSGAINAEAGGEIKFGSKKAELNGTASFSLSGPDKGKKFATN